jgi:hypothetical protein
MQLGLAVRIGLQVVGPRHPVLPAVRQAHAVFAMGGRAGVEHRLDELAYLLAVRRVDMVEQIAARERLGRGAELARVGWIHIRQRAVAPGQ